MSVAQGSGSRGRVALNFLNISLELTLSLPVEPRGQGGHVPHHFSCVNNFLLFIFSLRIRKKYGSKV